MMLFLPETALLKIVISGIIQMWFVLTFQITPHFISLFRCQFRIRIYNILKLIYHRSVRNENTGIFKMHIHIICSACAKKQIHPGFRKEFHGHGMGFRRFHGDIGMFPNRISCYHKSLKCMSALMCDHICISTRSIEICKNKRSLIIREIRHISAGFFGFTPQHIKQVIVTHKIHEFFCFI